MNTVTHHPSEKGQVLVLVVLAVVALLGFTALAVDGSMLYSDRRFAQNGADASSLAGGGKAALILDSTMHYNNWNNCTNSSIAPAATAARVAAAVRAGDNGFVLNANDQNLSDLHGVTTQCGTDTSSGWPDNYLDVRVMLTKDTPASFSQLIFNGPLRNTVEAVTRVRPRMDYAYGYAIVALREDCPNSQTGGVHYDGNQTLFVTNGGIFSNACMIKSGGVSVDVNPPNEGIDCIGASCYVDNGTSGYVNPAPSQGPAVIPRSAWEVPPPDCSSVPDRGSHTGDGTIQPGRYTQIQVHAAGEHLIMQPGLYCVSGGVTFNGGEIEGYGVTIYLTGGDFNTAGNITINLTAPDANNCGFCPPPIPGVLIYLAEGNTGEVSLLGDSVSDYYGMVYAPNGTIEVGGGSSLLAQIHTQLIGDTVFLHGNTVININFDDGNNAEIPTRLELYR